MVYCVGLTGNIASGKSTVASYFNKLGITVVDADAISKDLTKPDKPAFQKIINHFGQSVITTTGELNRRQLRQLIFNLPSERLWLEALLHPLIRNQIEHEISNVNTPYCLIEIPLLRDRTNYPYLNRILLVQANPEQQIARFMARDNSSKEDALAILATQADDTKRQAFADDLLMNTGSLTELSNNVSELHTRYLKYALANQPH